MILRFIDQARRAQEQHDRRVDVQLPLTTETDLPLTPSPGSVSALSGPGEPSAAPDHGEARGRAGALGQGLSAEHPQPSPGPLGDRIKLATLARSCDRLRAAYIRSIEADTGLTVIELADLVDVLETLSRYARGSTLTEPVEPRSLRVGPPTLRRVK